MTNPIGSAPLAGRPAVPAALLDQLADRSALAERFEHFQQAFEDTGQVPARLLELCRTRIDALHQQRTASTLDRETFEQVVRGDYAALSHVEQQALGLAEQLVIDAHGVSDGQIAKLATRIGEPAVVTLLTAIALHDTNVRMQKVLGDLAATRATNNTEDA